jgi:protein-L-isoaspartate(D-aspartate) O-methyltransferase
VTAISPKASLSGFELEREAMVERQLARRGIGDARVLDAMRQVPREEFVAADMRDYAYEDSALPIEAGQTISQPYIVACMAEAARIGPEDRVLEIGTGSGYAAAVIARIAERVYTIERHVELARAARERFERLGYGNIESRTGDGSKGWPDAAPFNAIIAAASGLEVPKAWREQLKIGGRIVMPLGAQNEIQRLMVIKRTGEDGFEEEFLGGVRFVPLIGGEE